LDNISPPVITQSDDVQTYVSYTTNVIIIIIITKELIKVTPSQLQTVTGALYNTLSPVTHQGMTAEKVFV